MKTISTVISQMTIPEGLIKISVSVTIENAKGKYFISKFRNETGDFITIDPDPRLIIRLRLNNTPWSPSQQIVIHQKQFEDFRIRVSAFYRKMLKSTKNYIYDESGRLVEVVKGPPDILVFQVYNQTIRMEPDLIEEKGGLKIPGIRMTFNEPNITAVLSFDEFESFYKEIERMSLHDKGMMLANSYMAFTKYRPEEILETYDKRYVESTNANGAKDIFKQDQSGEKVSGPIFKQPKSLFDL